MKISENSLLNASGAAYDYTDNFCYTFAAPADWIGLAQIAGAFSTPGPRWFEALFALRNRIAAHLGLHTTAPVAREGARELEPGATVGIFTVFGRTERELLLGEDDRHLDLRISVLLEDMDGGKKVTVTTAVRFNNRLGRCYFFVIKPFHRTVVPWVMKRNFRRLEAGH